MTSQKLTKCIHLFTSLTDEESRKLWEEFGHPDGKQAFQLGLALPSWLVEEENRVYVMIIYAVALGFGLPYLVVIQTDIRRNGGNLPRSPVETRFSTIPCQTTFVR